MSLFVFKMLIYLKGRVMRDRGKKKSFLLLVHFPNAQNRWAGLTQAWDLRPAPPTGTGEASRAGLESKVVGAPGSTATGRLPLQMVVGPPCHSTAVSFQFFLTFYFQNGFRFTKQKL